MFAQSVMLDKIKEAFAQFTALSPMDLIQVASIARLSMAKRGDFIVREGEYEYDVVIVVNGLLRHYVIDQNGEERTLRFVPEKGQTGMMETIFYNKPSPESIEVLENSVLVRLDMREADKIIANNVRLLTVQNQMFKELIASTIEQVRFLIIYTPEQRYDHFCKTYPNLEQRVKQKHLASYLGITPTSLSRMRARMVKG